MQKRQSPGQDEGICIVGNCVGSGAGDRRFYWACSSFEAPLTRTPLRRTRGYCRGSSGIGQPPPPHNTFSVNVWVVKPVAEALMLTIPD